MYKHKDQNGLVSIMVATVLMVIMSLITLGFVRIVQREQRQALDDQLSTQAFYAAESGINAVAQNITPAVLAAEKPDCDVSGYNNGIISSDNASDLVRVTCIRTDPNPSEIVFNNDSITQESPRVVPLDTNDVPETIKFEWKSDRDVYRSCLNDASLTLDEPANWNSIGAIDIDIIAVPASGISRVNLIGDQFKAILYPCDIGSVLGDANIEYDERRNARNIGKLTPVSCDSSADYDCSIEITNIPAFDNFYARFNSIYEALNVRITAYNAAGDQLKFSNVQLVVDSTGKANDVFRRLQARVPLYNSYNIPRAAIQAQNDVCKLYTVQIDTVVDGCTP